jgi:hypothetical protein
MRSGAQEKGGFRRLGGLHDIPSTTHFKDELQGRQRQWIVVNDQNFRHTAAYHVSYGFSVGSFPTKSSER